MRDYGYLFIYLLHVNVYLYFNSYLANHFLIFIIYLAAPIHLGDSYLNPSRSLGQ